MGASIAITLVNPLSRLGCLCMKVLTILTMGRLSVNR